MKIQFYIIGLILCAVSAENLSPTAYFNPINQHIKVIREFKGKQKKKNEPHISSESRSITESYLSIPELHQEVMDNWHTVLERYPSFLPSIIAQEKALSGTHYVFYHAQLGRLRVVNDIITHIYNRFHLNQNNPDFNFLRIWYKGLKNTSIEQLLTDEEAVLHPFAGHWDTQKHIAQKLLSVNLSLFGNCTWTWAGECTFHYFINNYSIKPPYVKDIINKLIDDFEISKILDCDQYTCFEKMLDEIINTYSQSDNDAYAAENLLDSGLLMQIFIPKDKVDNYVYLCHPCGKPYTKPICPEYFDTQKKRHLKISPIIEKYIMNPTAIENIDKLQARILLSQDMVLNPASEVKIYRYTLIDDEAQQAYEQDIEKMIDNLFDLLLQRASFTVHHPFYRNHLINKSPLSSLLKYMQREEKFLN